MTALDPLLARIAHALGPVLYVGFVVVVVYRNWCRRG